MPSQPYPLTDGLPSGQSGDGQSRMKVLVAGKCRPRDIAASSPRASSKTFPSHRLGPSVSPLPDDSAFWAYGRVAPFALTRFNVQEEQVAPGARVEVFADGIALWHRPGSTFARSVEESRDFLSLIVAAYALRSGVALDFAFSGWVEATKATFDGTMIGVVVDRRGHSPMMDPQGRRSTDMRAAVQLAAAVHHRGGWRLAVRDILAARRAADRRSDDCFVFAYRAIEDLAHAVSSTGDKSWPDLHALLGTDKPRFMRRLEPLRVARNAAGHGDESNPDLVTARANRDALVSRARRIVRDAIAHAPDLPTT